MNKNKIDNIVKFHFLFHSSHMDILDVNSEYILEKYNKIIGVTPKKIDSLSHDRIVVLDSKPGELELPWSDYTRSRWVKKWGSKEYNSCKEILNFILLTYLYHPDIASLLNIFEKYIGNPNDINSKVVLGVLHPLIKDGMDKYLEMVKRDYNLNILIDVL